MSKKNKSLTYQILELAKHNYEVGEPTLFMPDDVFDQVTEKLHEDSFNTDHNSRYTIKHSRSMYGLKKVKLDEIMKYIADFPNLKMEPKIDGIAFSAVYTREGFLKSVATRGNGLYGLDITELAKSVKGFPTELGSRKYCVNIRGEFYAKGKGYRTKVAGLFNKKLTGDKKKDEDIHRQINHEIGFCVYHGENAYFQSSFLYNDTFISTYSRFTKSKNDLKLKIEKFYNYCIENREYFPFRIDGIVVKTTDFKYSQRYNAGKYPKYAYAIKSDSEMVETMIVRIYETKGETGKITPIAEIKPVTIDGTTISKINLSSKNTTLYKRSYVGKLVKVGLKGMTIPFMEII